MKLIQNKTKVVETKVVVEHACDLCGLKNEKPDSGHWSPETTYSINRVTIEHVTGAVYPESSLTTTTSFDICPGCFHDTLAPFLESKGAKPLIQTKG